MPTALWLSALVWSAPALRMLQAKSYPAEWPALGQAIWAKGYTELLALMDADHARAGDAGSVPVDCYGSGEDLEEVKALVQSCLMAVAHAKWTRGVNAHSEWNEMPRHTTCH